VRPRPPPGPTPPPAPRTTPPAPRPPPPPPRATPGGGPAGAALPPPPTSPARGADAAGWGYLLSRDAAAHALAVRDAWESGAAAAPAWYGAVRWEDVQLGLALSSAVRGPFHHPGFKRPWDACGPDTVLRHLDADAPALVPGLHAQELSGLWGLAGVRCSSGPFEAGDYSAWRAWHNAAFPGSRV